ncbi:MAG: DUF2167 domain-containing protein [Pseudoxanthomonas sp.]
MKNVLRGLLAAGLAVLAASAWAQEAAEEDPTMTAEQFVASLHFRDGEIAVPEAAAHFRLGPAFRYLDKADTRRVLEDMWGNPPDDSVLGMIVPAQPALGEDGSWAVVVTYADDGYVSDEDAAKIDYDDLLKDMKDGIKEENAERKKAGFHTVDLVGWAVPPRYDADSKKLYWAKELAFEGNPQHTLNYDIRVLGRRGYLSLNAIADLSELDRVRQGMQQLLPMAEFDDGARYADYDASSDKVAAYGIAALIGGGLAAKAGLFAKLGLLLAKFWKLGLIAVVALGGTVKRLFSGRDKRRQQGTIN